MCYICRSGLAQFIASQASILNNEEVTHLPGDPRHFTDVYEHLLHIIRVCKVHGERRIKTSKAPHSVKIRMSRLFCYESSTWDEDVSVIMNDPFGYGKSYSPICYFKVDYDKLNRRVACEQNPQPLDDSGHAWNREPYTQSNLANYSE